MKRADRVGVKACLPHGPIDADAFRFGNGLFGLLRQGQPLFTISGQQFRTFRVPDQLPEVTEGPGHAGKSRFNEDRRQIDLFSDLVQILLDGGLGLADIDNDLGICHQGSLQVEAVSLTI